MLLERFGEVTKSLNHFVEVAQTSEPALEAMSKRIGAIRADVVARVEGSESKILSRLNMVLESVDRTESTLCKVLENQAKMTAGPDVSKLNLSTPDGTKKDVDEQIASEMVSGEPSEGVKAGGGADGNNNGQDEPYKFNLDKLDQMKKDGEI